ncbi:MAG: hypothetical protein ACTHNB_08975 [Gaiellaceae bacterium]
MRAWLEQRRTILVAAIVSRVLVLAAAAIGHEFRWSRRLPVHIASTAHTLTTLGYWDGKWYRTVAERGYLLIPGRESDPAFFPLFPILLRGVHALGLSYLTAGLVIANLAFVAGLLAFNELSRYVVDAETAKVATVLVAFFPMSFVFSMTYPESLVLLALALTLLLALRGRWTACACAGSIAVLTRPEALLFLIPLAVIAVGYGRTSTKADQGRAIGAALAPVASFLTFPLYLGWAVHDVFAWSHAQAGWGRAFGLEGFGNAFNGLFQPGATWLWREVAFSMVYLVLLVAARRNGVPRSWILAGAAIVLIPLASGSFMSAARFGLLALPAYWGLAYLARRSLVRRALLVVSAGLLVAGTITIPLVTP